MHRHILLYFYTHHLAHIDYKIRRQLNQIATLDAVCSLLFVFVILYIISYMTHYLDIYGTIEQYRATLGF